MSGRVLPFLSPERPDAVVELPKACVMVHELGQDRVLCVSYDEEGDIFERFETFKALATPELYQRMADRIKLRATALLRLVREPSTL